MTGGEHRDPANFTVGSEVAGYRLEEQIGQGGMAVVYRARDVQLGRNVALKLLSPVLALDDAFRQRFIRESRAAAAVDHPYIIPIFAAGESDGALFIAMRYVQGGDVRSLIDAEGPLPPDRAAGIITQVALALDAAHLHGLVHRDIKPANMLLDSVAGSGQRDHVYLADFGLSKRSLSVTGLTSIGQFLGTPAYVAPEQVEGRPVDSRADQYALACASFEILSGAPPYERDDDLAVMWAHVSVPPPSLSERRPSLPAAADAVLARAMAKAPADRYPTCIAFALALRQALGAKVEPGELMVPEPGRPPTVVSGPAAGRPGEPAGPRPHPATEISWPRARPEAGSAAAADQGGPGVPGRPAAPEPRAASQQQAAGPAERSAPPYGAPPSRDAPAAAPGPELPPPPGSYKPPPGFLPPAGAFGRSGRRSGLFPLRPARGWSVRAPDGRWVACAASLIRRRTRRRRRFAAPSAAALSTPAPGIGRHGATRPGRPWWCAAAGPGSQPAGTESALVATGRRGHRLRGRGRDRRRGGAGPGRRDQEPGRGRRQLSRRGEGFCSRAPGALGSGLQHRCRRRRRPVPRPIGGR